MRAKKVYENISFERGKDPKDTLDIGDKKLRELMRLSNDELIIQAATIYKKDEGDIIKALVEKNKGTKKSHWQEKTAEARAIYNSRETTDSRGNRNYMTKIRSLMHEDELEKLKKYRDLGIITNNELSIELQFGGGFSYRRHHAVPQKLSSRMLQWLIKEIPDYRISNYEAPTLVKNASKEDLPKLFPLILKTKTDEKQDRLKEMCLQLVYRNEKDLFIKYISRYKGEFNPENSNERKPDDFKEPDWFKKWMSENFIKDAFDKLMRSNWIKEEISVIQKRIKGYQEEIELLKKKNPSNEDKEKIVKEYYHEFKKQKEYYQNN